MCSDVMILRILRQHGPLLTRQIAAIVSEPPTQISRHLWRLRTSGRVTVLGATWPRRYGASPHGAPPCLRAPLPWDAVRLLLTQGPRTATQIAEHIQARPSSVARMLRRHADEVEGRRGPGRTMTYHLRDDMSLSDQIRHVLATTGQPMTAIQILRALTSRPTETAVRRVLQQEIAGGRLQETRRPSPFAPTYSIPQTKRPASGVPTRA